MPTCAALGVKSSRTEASESTSSEPPPHPAAARAASARRSARASRMANEENRRVPIRVLDGHNDVLLALEEAELRGRPLDFARGSPELAVDGPDARAGGFAGGFLSCFAPDELPGPDLDDEVVLTDEGWEIPYAGPIDREHARDTVVALTARLLELERAGALRVARRVADVEAAVERGRPAAILHIEGAEAIDPDDLH